MLHQYCKSCGGKTCYDSIAPKCCSACGELFISPNQSPPSNVTIARKSISKPSILFINRDETDEQIPQITSLAYEVKNKPNTRGFRIGDLRGQPEDTGRVGAINKKAKRPKIDPKSFMSDSKASGRNSTEIGG